MKIFVCLLIFISSLANASLAKFICKNGILDDADGKLKQQAFFRFVPASDIRFYYIQKGADDEGGYYTGHFSSYERPNDLIQLEAKTLSEDTFNGVAIRTREIHVRAQRLPQNGPWSIRHTVRMKTKKSEETFVDVYHFAPQDCGWY